MKVGSIVIRCYEFDKMLAFWQQALHYIPREPAKSGWVVLRDPEKTGPNVSLDQVREERSGERSKLHLDLYTDSRDGEVERLVKIGATRYPCDIDRTMALSSWKTPTATSSAWSR